MKTLSGIRILMVALLLVTTLSLVHGLELCDQDGLSILPGINETKITVQEISVDTVILEEVKLAPAGTLQFEATNIVTADIGHQMYFIKPIACYEQFTDLG